MKQAIEWTNCKVKLGDLKPWPGNPRMSSKAQAKRLLDSWSKFGQVMTIAIDSDNNVLDGHQRLSALLTLHDKKYIIDARRSSRKLTDKERRELVITLHAGAVGEWNWDDLANWDAPDLIEWGFDTDTLKDWKQNVSALGNLIESEKPDVVDADVDLDRAAELQVKWGTARGQVWKIGEHRLMCGDSTSREDVGKLMEGDSLRLFITDAPYGVSYAEKNKYLNTVAKGNRVQTPIENDSLNTVEVQELWFATYKNAFAFADAGCPYYICSPQGGELMMMMMMMMIQKAGWLLKPHIIWSKNNHVLGRSDYQLKHEPILYGWKPGTHWFYGGRSQMSVWEIDKPIKSEFHPTMKPVALFEKAIINSSVEGEVVGDYFSGSGTTLIACQNLNRKCRAMEIAPEYVAVALERMELAFGITGVKIE